jgi:hypothetical protein
MEGPSPSPPPAGLQVDTDLNCAVCGKSLRGLPLSGACANCGTAVMASIKRPQATIVERARVRMTPRGEVVLDDRPCLTCGYNLRSLPTSGKCPECAAPVERSLRGLLLRYSSPTYLARLRRGILLVEVTIGLQILYRIAMVIVGFAIAIYSLGSSFAMMRGSGPMPIATIKSNLAIERVTLLVTAALEALGLVGWWLFTTPDEAIAQRDPAYHWRRLLRWFLAISAFTTATSLLLTFVPAIMTEINAASGGPFSLPRITGRLVLKMMSGAAFLMGFISTMMYMTQLARRVPDMGLKKRADIYSWLLPVIFIVGFPLLGLGPIAAFILYAFLIDDWRRRLKKLDQSVMAEDLVPKGIA